MTGSETVALVFIGIPLTALVVIPTFHDIFLLPAKVEKAKISQMRSWLDETRSVGYFYLVKPFYTDSLEVDLERDGYIEELRSQTKNNSWDSRYVVTVKGEQWLDAATI